MDWMGVISNEPTLKEEMSRLVVGFAVRMFKRALGLEGESNLIPNVKRPKKSSPDEEAQND